MKKDTTGKGIATRCIHSGFGRAVLSYRPRDAVTSQFLAHPVRRGKKILVIIYQQCFKGLVHHDCLYTPLKAEKAPSTATVAPCTKTAISESNVKAGPIKSSGRPNRPSGVWAMIRCPRSVSSPLALSISRNLFERGNTNRENSL